MTSVAILASPGLGLALPEYEQLQSFLLLLNTITNKCDHLQSSASTTITEPLFCLFTLLQYITLKRDVELFLNTSHRLYNTMQLMQNRSSAFTSYGCYLKTLITRIISVALHLHPDLGLAICNYFEHFSSFLHHHTANSRFYHKQRKTQSFALFISSVEFLLKVFNKTKLSSIVQRHLSTARAVDVNLTKFIQRPTKFICGNDAIHRSSVKTNSV